MSKSMAQKPVLIVGLVLLFALTGNSVRARQCYRNTTESNDSGELEPDTESKLAFYRVRPQVKKLISSAGSFKLDKYRKQIVDGGTRYFLKVTHTSQTRRRSPERRVYNLKVFAPLDSKPRFLMEKAPSEQVTEITDGPGCKIFDEEILSHWTVIFRYFQTQLLEQLKMSQRIQPTFGVFGEKSCEPVQQTVTFMVRLRQINKKTSDIKLIEPCCLTLESFDPVESF